MRPRTFDLKIFVFVVVASFVVEYIYFKVDF